MIAVTHAPIHFLATPAAARAFGPALPDVAREAFLEIGRVARGYAIHPPQFRAAGGALVMVASRVKASGIVEIEIDCGHPGLPARTFTCEEAARIGGRRR